MSSTRIVGLAFVLLGAAIAALIPVFLVLYPAAGIGRADAGNPDVVLPILARTPALAVGPGVLQVFGHAIGAAAILGLWLRSESRSYLFACATLGGLVWTSVDLIDNGIFLQLAPALAAQFVGGDSTAGSAFLSVSKLTDAIRLSGHFAGGIWVLGASIFFLRERRLVPSPVAWAGVVVGTIFAANLFVPALLNITFLTLPLWLIAFGAVVARARVASGDAAFAPLPSTS